METMTTRELAFRANDGVEVSLVWSETDNGLRVLVADSKAGHSFELSATSENALDVFYHPYAYAAFNSVGYSLAA
jgi:hypothetical protein